MTAPRPMTTPIINASTVWYMHRVIMEMDYMVPFADTWNIRTGFTKDMTETDIAIALVKEDGQGQKTKKRCVAAWREFCHICLDYLSVT